MELGRALRLEAGHLVAFSGAGGKTSALKRLIEEFSPRYPLLITTSTKIGVDQFKGLPAHVVDDGRDLVEITQVLGESDLVLLTGPLDEAGRKWTGISPQRIDDLRTVAADMGVITLVEADGARQRWIKAPEEHEPVIPTSADMVVPVVNLKAMGLPLDEQSAHRPGLLANVVSSQLGKPIQASHLIDLITSERGGLKGAPPGAEIRPLLAGLSSTNQASALEIAQGCLQRSQRLLSVVLADLAAGAATGVQAVSRVAGVVLAAGEASRMGELKQLRQWNGKPLVLHAVEAAAGAGLDPIIVVTGHQSERLRQALASTSVQFIENEEWQQGQSASMKLGLKQLPPPVEAVVFLLADMPLVGPDLVARLVEKHRQSLAPIVAPRAGERYGNPVLFDRRTFDALMAVSGDTGGKAIFPQFEVASLEADRSALVDVDTQADWEALDS